MSASSLPLPQGKSVSLKQFVSRHINEIGLLVVVLIHLKYEKNREDIGLFGIWRD